MIQSRFPEVVYLEKTLIDEKIATINKLFADNYAEPLPKVAWVKETHNGAEVVEFMDTSQRNQDLPDNLVFTDMGLSSRVNEHLDHQLLNDRDFRQRCVQANGRNYVLYQKTLIDMQKPQHLRSEWLAEQLGIQIDLAYKLADAFSKLKLDRKAVMKILHGYVTSAGEHKNGLIGSNGNMVKVVELLDMLGDEADEVTVKRSEFVPNDIFTSFKEDTIYALNVGSMNPYSDEVTQADDDIDQMGDNNPYSAFPLYDGSEALSHEFLTMIRTASFNKLRIIQQGFFKQEDVVSGRVYKAKYHYMTPSQKSQAWVYIKARKAELKEATRANLSQDAEITIGWIKALGKSKVASALIFAFADGRAFDLFGQVIEFSDKANSLELGVVWDEYKKLVA